ncbi:anti-sigma factor family protein [Edaphobacter aggregans]|uniref:anti-sigma factor family protein n=1 Tax=Edaphobacter aggregans TaxID=570835 RepID=UPI00054E255E|nr:zf-HC2 domain-containing protein [Edaphobacter aggregans]
MIKNHDDYGVMIQLLIDDELTGHEREDLISHINDCASCQEELEEAQAFSARVRSARPQVEAPAALREKILSNINNSTNRSVRAYWRPLAAAAMFLVTVGVVLSLSYLRRESRAMSFVEAAIAEHRISSNDRSLDVESSSPEVVATWFAQRVSFPFRMPNEGIAADDRAKYTLAGGRLVTFSGQPAALVEFRMQNNRITLLVTSDKLVTATGGKITSSGGLRFHASDRGELHVATWNNKGLTYALISAVAMGSSRSCSFCHRDSPAATTTMKSPHDTFLYPQPMPEISANQVDRFLN